MEKFDSKYLKLRHPFTSIVSGPTGSGKTILIRRILSNWKYALHFDNYDFAELKVLWIYGQYQELYKTPISNVNVTYSEFLPELEEIKQRNYKLIIFDDLMEEMSKNESMSKLFTRVSHHMNISVIFIVQNYFLQTKYMRTISLNTQYIILLANFRDQNQIAILGNQLFKEKSKSFRMAYLDATKKI